MHFTAIIEKDENGYFAYVPELKGCVSEGKSYEEAFCKKLVGFTQNLYKKMSLKPYKQNGFLLLLYK